MPPAAPRTSLLAAVVAHVPAGTRALASELVLAEARRRVRAAELAETTFRKRCPRCATDLPRSAFGKHSSRPDGLQGVCRGCRAGRGPGEWDGVRPN